MKAILMPMLNGHMQTVLDRTPLEVFKRTAMQKIESVYDERTLISTLYSLLAASILKSRFDPENFNGLVVEVDDSLAPPGVRKIL